MNSTRAGEDISVIRERIKNAIIKNADMTIESSNDIAFHMTDWIADFDALSDLFENIEESTDQDVYETILKFLLHVPTHLVNAATLLTGETTEELLSPREDD